MKRGLVLGKFMPLHYGHIGLIEFALRQCEHLTVLLCYYSAEPISGSQRLSWLRETFTNHSRVEVMSYEYNPQQLPDSSEPKPEYGRLWAEKIKNLLPDIDVFFSSETYGDNVAACLGIEHRRFDEARQLFPISASQIRQKPFTYWHFLPEVVQPYFVKKITLAGSESTGKSTLTERLAVHHQTVFAPEVAREIVAHTDECTFEHLGQIAERHAKTIIAKTRFANKILFCDTDLAITNSYCQFLFQKELKVPSWIEDANHCDFYLFLETDCPYVQDGTRLEETKRNMLSSEHKKNIKRLGIDYKIITGNWEERFQNACREINAFISKL